MLTVMVQLSGIVAIKGHKYRVLMYNFRWLAANESKSFHPSAPKNEKAVEASDFNELFPFR